MNSSWIHKVCRLGCVAITSVTFDALMMAQQVSFDQLVGSAVGVRTERGRSGSGVLLTRAQAPVAAQQGVLDIHGPIVVTAQHITNGDRSADIIFPVFENGEVLSELDALRERGAIVSGRVVHENPATDVAIIVPDPFARIASSGATGGGLPVWGIRLDERDLQRYVKGFADVPCWRVRPIPQQVFHLGNPLGSLWRFGSARVVELDEIFPIRGVPLRPNESPGVCDRIVLEGSVLPGHSGSMVVDRSGSLLGIVSAGRARGLYSVLIPLQYLLDATSALSSTEVTMLVNDTNDVVRYSVVPRDSPRRVFNGVIRPGRCHPLIARQGLSVYPTEDAVARQRDFGEAWLPWSTSGPRDGYIDPLSVVTLPCTTFSSRVVGHSVSQLGLASESQ